MRTSTPAGKPAVRPQAFVDSGLDGLGPADDDLDIEHASVQALIDQLRCLDAVDEKYATRFTVLCDYVLRDTPHGADRPVDAAGTSTAL